MRKLARADALARKTGLGFFVWNLNWGQGLKFKLGRDLDGQLELAWERKELEGMDSGE